MRIGRQASPEKENPEVLWLDKDIAGVNLALVRGHTADVSLHAMYKVFAAIAR